MISMTYAKKNQKNEVVCYIHGIGTSEGLEIAYNDKIKCFLTFGNWLISKIGHLLQNLPTTGGLRAQS